MATDPENPPPIDDDASDTRRMPAYVPGLMAQRWLARLSFSFIIIALWLGWTAMHLPPEAGWRKYLYLTGAAASFAVGMAGIRARHRGDRDGPWR